MPNFIVTPNGIRHPEKPAFRACWISGDVAVPDDGYERFYHEGSGEYDGLLIYKIEWADETPDRYRYADLMNQAVTAIDGWIAERF